MRISSGQPLAVVFVLLMTCVPGVLGQGLDFDAIELETFELGRGLYVLMGGPAQGNILVSIGSDGIFLVDTMYGPMHEKIMAALAELGDQRVRYVVNTHMHGDHTAGNEAMAGMGAVVIAHENLRVRMAAQEGNPAARLPVRTYSDRMTLYFNGEEIEIYNPGQAHTDHDSIIYFRNANVMHVGDIPSSLRYPNIGVNDGGTVEGMMAAARQVMEIGDSDTRFIAGHLGPVVGFDEIEQQLEMFAVVRDRVAEAIRDGQTLEEVVASKPTADFDEARLAGAITPDRFVTLVYTDLSRAVR
jgi:cyclase